MYEKSEKKQLWEESQELRKLFGSGISFCTWYGRNIKIANPTIEEVIKKAKKRFLTENDRFKYKKRHNIRRDK